MKKGAKKKGGKKGRRGATSSSPKVVRDDDTTMTETPPAPSTQATPPSPSTQATQPSPSTQATQPSSSTQATQPTPSTQATQPTPSTQVTQPIPSTQATQPTPSTQATVVKKEPEEAMETQEEEAMETQEEEAKPPEQETDLNVKEKEVVKGASSSKPVDDSEEEEDPDVKPLILRKRTRSATKEDDNSPAPSAAKRSKATKTKTQDAETEYFIEPRRLEDLWKQAFPAGTELARVDELYKTKWDFTNLEEALEKGGTLFEKMVYVFGSTESHSVPDPDNDENKTVLVPVIVCVESSVPPSDRIGTISVTNDVEAEEIIPMKTMKMAWVPFIPLHERQKQFDRANFQIYIMRCTQRSSAVKHLKDERVNKFNSCLPYINNPYRVDESEQSTVAKITFPSEPPVVLQYDWETDNLEEFTDELIKQEAVLADRKDEFKEFVTVESDKVRAAYQQAEQAREAAKEKLTDKTKVAYQAMKLYKFYPLPSPNTPDISAIEKSPVINKYFGKADEVL